MARTAAASSDEKHQAHDTTITTTRDVGATDGSNDDDRVMGDRSRAWQELKGEDGADEMERRTTRSGGSADEIPIEMAAVVGGMGNSATATAAASNAPQRRVSGATDDAAAEAGEGAIEYKVYKRRWFGLVQLALLNVIVSWDVSGCLFFPFGVCAVSSRVAWWRVGWVSLSQLSVCLLRGGPTPVVRIIPSAMHKTTPQCRSIPSTHLHTPSTTPPPTTTPH